MLKTHCCLINVGEMSSGKIFPFFASSGQHPINTPIHRAFSSGILRVRQVCHSLPRTVKTGPLMGPLGVQQDPKALGKSLRKESMIFDATCHL